MEELVDGRVVIKLDAVHVLQGDERSKRGLKVVAETGVEIADANRVQRSRAIETRPLNRDVGRPADGARLLVCQSPLADKRDVSFLVAAIHPECLFQDVEQCEGAA